MDVPSNNAFQTNVLRINPGNSNCFPWLSTLANSFETYQLHKLSFEYCPTCPSSTPGYHAMMVEYDADDDPPGTKSAFLMNETAYSGTVWSPMKLNCDSHMLKSIGPDRYTRPRGVTPADQELKLYDAGFLCWTSAGNPSPQTTIGEIWVEYDVTLLSPQQPNVSAYAYSSKVTGNGTVSKGQPFGVSPIVLTDLSGVAVSSGTVLDFQTPGQYLMEVAYVGTVLTTPTYAGANLTSFTLGSTIINAGLTAMRTLSFFEIPVSEIPSQILFDLTLSGTVTNCVVRIAPYNYAYL